MRIARSPVGRLLRVARARGSFNFETPIQSCKSRVVLLAAAIELGYSAPIGGGAAGRRGGGGAGAESESKVEGGGSLLAAERREQRRPTNPGFT